MLARGFVGVVTSAALLAAAGSVCAKDVVRGSVVSLADEGKISTQLTASGAYKLTVKVKNRTDSPLAVEFPPGLVADTYSRFAFFQQGGGQGGQGGGGIGGGTGGGGGGQSMSIFDGIVMNVPPGGSQTAILATACMNFGVPEPTASTVLFLKPVEDFTTHPVLRRLLPAIASNKINVNVGQAAIWHVVDGLTWQQLGEIGNGRLRVTFSSDVLAEAQRLVSAATSLSTSQVETKTAFGGESAKREFAPLAMMVHPDPRGAKLGGELACRLTKELRERFPMFEVSHRNEILPPVDPTQAAYSWFVFVRASPAAKGGAALSVQRNLWNPAKRNWQRDAFGPVALGVKGKPAVEVDGAELTDSLLTEVAGKGIRLEPTNHIPKDGVIRVYNELPISLASLSIRDMKSTKPVKFADLKIPAGGTGELKVTDIQRDHLGTVKRLVATAFEVK